MPKNGFVEQPEKVKEIEEVRNSLLTGLIAFHRLISRSELTNEEMLLIKHQEIPIDKLYIPCGAYIIV